MPQTPHNPPVENNPPGTPGQSPRRPDEPAPSPPDQHGIPGSGGREMETAPEPKLDPNRDHEKKR